MWCTHKRRGESVGHLLIDCDEACDLWNIIFESYGLRWVMLYRVVDLFGCWRWKLSSLERYFMEADPAYGGKEMLGHLTIARRWIQFSNLFSLELYSIGWVLDHVTLLLLFMIFYYSFLLLIRCISSILLVYLDFTILIINKTWLIRKVLYVHRKTCLKLQVRIEAYRHANVCKS